MKKQSRKLLSFVLALVMFLGVAVPVQAAKKVKLSSTKVTVRVGKTKTIQVKNTSKKIKWSVVKGKAYIKLTKKKKQSVVIKGKKAGNAKILAKAGKKKLYCKVTVKGAEVPVPDPVAVTPGPSVQPSVQPQASQPAGTTQPGGQVPSVPSQTVQPGDNVSSAPSQEPSAVPSVIPSQSADPNAPGGFQYEGLDTGWIDPSKPMVAFTFDDRPVGNSDTSTSMIIQNALTAHNAHATFFYIGSQINSNAKKAEIRQAKERGFEVGNHSYGWSDLSSLKEEEIKKSVGDTNAILTELTGYSHFLFRAPNLSVSNTMKESIEAPFIQCGTDSKDWDKATKEQIVANVKAAKDGDIVLMHETQKNTADAINEILDYFEEKGWQVVSVSELFAVRGKKLITGTEYSSCAPVKG